MYSKENFLKEIRHEGEVLKHLVTKLPLGCEHERLAPNGRTTLELMRYLAIVAIGTATYTQTSNWDHFGPLNASVADLDRHNFASFIDKQTKAVVTLVNGISDSDMVKKTCDMPWGEKVPVGIALINMTLSFMKAYRLEFFLRAKAAGNTEIGTANCWMGRDAQPKA